VTAVPAPPIPGPLALIAEITYRCPLHCVYCSNPLQMAARGAELDAETWIGVFRQAARMGTLQIDLTGGEPLARRELVELVAGARDAKLYVNLITSGIGLTEARLAALVEAGLEHVQLSFQDVQEKEADAIAGARAHAQKIVVAGWLRRHRLAFTMNAVFHRHNLERLEEMIALAEQLGAGRLEVAHVQYYGWALQNREELLPTRTQLDRSVETVRAAQERLKGRMRIDFVVPDYYARYPKPCMGGWGRRLLLINPAGAAMPCHAAGVIPGMEFANVGEHPLRWIWEESPAFRRFRGDDWMQEPCRSCDRRDLDFGGCRCQAFQLAGDAAATDPICSLSPAHDLVSAMVARVNAPRPEASPGDAVRPAAWLYRRNPA
jgi:pyrroloquinoline quinone biosynthesis protein E